MKNITLFILIMTVFLVCFPLMKPGFFVSDDGGWMIVRLSAFYQSLAEGQFPVRFLGRLNFSYGYPVANFLYPGFMYIGSVIHFLGFSFVDTVKIIFGGSIILGTLFTYLWLKKYFSDNASLLGTFGFITSPYLLFDLYHRGSVGEILALSMASMGFYSIASKKPWLFGLSVALLILSHNTLALLFLVIFTLYITVIRSWKEFFLMFIVGIGATAFFWFPALYERKYVLFNSITVSNPKEFFVILKILPVAGILAAVSSFALGTHLKPEKRLFLFVFVCSFILASPLAGFVWNLPVLTTVIQFPYRLLALIVPVSAWLTAYVFMYAKKQMAPVFLCICIALGLVSVTSTLNRIVLTHEPEGYYTTNEATTTVADEYMPKWVTKKPVSRDNERLLFHEGAGTVVENTVSTQILDVIIRANEDSVVQINTVYYPGWGATLDGIKADIDYSNLEGVMRISVPAGDHNLVVAFRETISRFLADIATLISITVYVFLIVSHRKKAGKK